MRVLATGQVVGAAPPLPGLSPMKPGLQSSAAEFVPSEGSKFGTSPTSSKASPSLAANLAATPFVPSVSSAANSPLVLNAPVFKPGAQSSTLHVRMESMRYCDNTRGSYDGLSILQRGRLCCRSPPLRRRRKKSMSRAWHRPCFPDQPREVRSPERARGCLVLGHMVTPKMLVLWRPLWVA